jgi:lipoprotein
MKKLLFVLAASATILSGCSKEEGNNIAPVEKDGISVLNAIIPESRTTLDGLNVIWSPEDKLSVWSDERQTPLTYALTAGAGETTATFEYNKPNENAPGGIVGKEYYAVYPFNTKTTVSGNQGYIELPKSQDCTSVENFEPTFNPMAAVNSELNNMVFHNLCGIVVVEVTPDQDLSLTKIVLETNGSQPLCGPAVITFPAPGAGVPTLKATDASSNQLTLACQNVTLTKGVAAKFYIVVPAGKYDNMSITIFTNLKYDETLRKVRFKKALNIAAGEITTVGANFDLITVEPHSYEIGDKYPFDAASDADVKGIVFALTNAEGTAGKVMAINDCGAENATYTWGPAKATPVMASATDGSVNMAIANNNISSYPAFEACKNYSVEGLDWYLPARDELQAIMNNYNTLESTWRSVTGKTEETDYMLPGDNYWTSSMGGTRNKTVYYWTYTETSGMKETAIGSVATSEYSVRAVAKFSSK